MRAWRQISKVSWLAVLVLASWGVSSAHANLYKFDMGTATSLVQSGYTQITNTTTYTASLGYGWASALYAVDQVGPGTMNALYKDCNYDPLTTADTFKVDVPADTYTVTLYFYNNSAKDHMQVLAQGNPISGLTDFNLPAGTPVTKTFNVTVSTGQLNLTFQKNSGNPGTTNWIINGIDISSVPLPSTLFLLGTGLMGLGLVRRKRRSKS